MKTNIKLRVTPEQSEAVQKICFANGINWDGTGKFYHLNKPFIYIYELSISCDNKESSRYFRNHENKEVDADLFIRTNGTCEESIDIVDNLSNNKSKEDIFKQYGFEVPDFDCELLGIVSGPYKKDKFVVGTIKKGIFNNCPHMWSIKYGTCYTSSIASNMYDYNLTPIKKPWHETCKFPVLLIKLDGLHHETYGLASHCNHPNELCVNNAYEHVRDWRPLSNEEIDQLKQDF